MDLYEWSKHYIKFKDCMKKNIQDMKFKEQSIFVTEKNRTINYIIAERLSEGITQLNEEQIVIITLNTKANFDELITSWNTIKDYKQLTIIFTHPDQNETWLVHPYTHHNITEEKKLKEGLLTLFNNIPRV